MSEPFSAEELLQHRSFLRSLARRLVQDDATAEDVVQKTWIAAWRNDQRPTQWRPWLSRVVRNVAWKARRGEARRQRRETLAASDGQELAADRVVERLELEKLLADAVLTLPPRQRTLVALHFYEELSLREAARRMELPYATAHRLLQDALSTLRARLERDGGERWSWVLGGLLSEGILTAGPSGAVSGAKVFSVSFSPIGALLAGVILILTSIAWIFSSSPVNGSSRNESEPSSGTGMLSQSSAHRSVPVMTASSAPLPFESSSTGVSQVEVHVVSVADLEIESGFLEVAIGVEIERIALQPGGLAVLEDISLEEPPRVLVQVEGHEARLIAADDPQWQTGAIEVQVAPTRSVTVRVVDAVDGVSVEGATVVIDELPRVDCDGIPDSWVSILTPSPVVSDPTGRAILDASETTTSLWLKVNRDLYWENLLEVPLEAEGEAVVRLSPVLAAGLEVRTGDDRFDARQGLFAYGSTEGIEPHHESTAHYYEHASRLSDRLGLSERPIIWIFARPDPREETALLPAKGNVDYRIFGGAAHHEIELTYRRFMHVRAMDVKTLDVAEEVRERGAFVEVAFEGLEDVSLLPMLSWGLRAEGLSKYEMRYAFDDGTWDNGERVFRFAVQAGRHHIEPKARYHDPAIFSPLEVEVRAGKTRRVVIPPLESPCGSVEILITLKGHRISTPLRMTLQPEARSGPLSYIQTFPVSTGDRVRLLPGHYKYSFYRNSQRTEKQSIEITGGSSTTLELAIPDDWR
ncbi:MAG: RNA polymerase sigma factor [Planctomycetota bacterium]